LENPKVKAYDTARLSIKRVLAKPCYAADPETMGTIWERNMPDYDAHVCFL